MSAKVLDKLAECRGAALTAISQLMGHYYDMEKEGKQELATMFKQNALERMTHAEVLAKRIYSLGEKPKSHLLKHPSFGGDLKKKLRDNIKLVRESVKRLADGIVVCEEGNDNESSGILQKILGDEEKQLQDLEREFKPFE